MFGLAGVAREWRAKRPTRVWVDLCVCASRVERLELLGFMTAPPTHSLLKVRLYKAAPSQSQSSKATHCWRRTCRPRLGGLGCLACQAAIPSNQEVTALKKEVGLGDTVSS